VNLAYACRKEGKKKGREENYKARIGKKKEKEKKGGKRTSSIRMGGSERMTSDP